MSIQTVERPVQTCATCPLLNPDQGVHGWCRAFDRMAKPHHERTATCDQEIAAQEEVGKQRSGGAEEHYPTRQSQPADEYEQGLAHGQRDALERLHPIYEENLHEYARGYVQGYQSILNPPQQQLTEVRYQQGFAHGQADAKARLFPGYDCVSCQYTAGYLAGYHSVNSSQTEWSVTYNDKWHWYDVWVGDKWVGRASNHQEAERVAQKYLAEKELIQKQNAIVRDAYLAAVV